MRLASSLVNSLGITLLIIILEIQCILCRDGMQQGPPMFQNGYPVQYVSGSMHYMRVHPSDWRDRLKKMRWAGLQAVQTYVEWSSHEPEPGVYKFSEGLDIVKFIETAREEGLYVILRPGPFICAERDMGGLPYWLMRLEPHVKLRTSDPKFMKYVSKWYDVLLPRLKPYMYDNGGPIMMIQVENEYGNCGECDFQYLTDLANIFRKGLGKNVFLFSTDNPRTNALRCAKIPGVYATIDFGPDANITSEFEVMRLFEPKGPLICSEFSTGWFDHWGDPHEKKSAKELATGLMRLLDMGASANFYVFHGGTSFGFGAGSNLGAKFQSSVTSYDYDAPLSEAGDPTEKYFAIRNVIKEYFPVPSGPPPPPSKKFSYGEMKMKNLGTMFDLLPYMPYKVAENPSTFEEIGLANGLMAYQTVLQNRIHDPANLDIFNVHDRGYVYIDNTFFGVISREEFIFAIPIFAKPNQTLTVFVESQGRIGVGSQLKDFKGILSTPLINGNYVKNWKMTPLPFSGVEEIYLHLKGIEKQQIYINQRDQFLCTPGMTFYKAVFKVPNSPSHPRDTFLKLDMWKKGYVWVNNFLLGRYWTVVGPQMTLYVPHGILKRGPNEILILELEKSCSTVPKEMTISLVDAPIIDGPTPVH